MTMIIPTRFSSAINQHVVLSLVELESQPVIMGIFGRPGEGKTHQLRAALKRIGVQALSINAADLESDRAGTPGKTVLAGYLNASRAIEKSMPTCIVIDDVDTTVGEWENNTGTVNHQQVLAQLMHLADSPNQIEQVGRVKRAPIFLTGNDFGKIYGPLRRPGRILPFHWQPTPEERGEVVLEIFNDLLSPRQVTDLLTQYPEQPVAFFSDVRSRIISSGTAPLIQQLAKELTMVCQNPGLFKERLLQSAAKYVTRDGAQKIANDLAQSHNKMLQSYLQLE